MNAQRGGPRFVRNPYPFFEDVYLVPMEWFRRAMEEDASGERIIQTLRAIAYFTSESNHRASPPLCLADAELLNEYREVAYEMLESSIVPPTLEQWSRQLEAVIGNDVQVEGEDEDESISTSTISSPTLTRTPSRTFAPFTWCPPSRAPVLDGYPPLCPPNGPRPSYALVPHTTSRVPASTIPWGSPTDGEVGPLPFPYYRTHEPVVDGRPRASRYFVIWVGREVGIYRCYAASNSRTDGFPNNRHWRCKSWEDAADLFNYGLAHAQVYDTPFATPRQPVSSPLPSLHKPAPSSPPSPALTPLSLATLLSVATSSIESSPDGLPM